MPEKKMDRRVKYSQMVIKESFIALLAEKPISKITVKELCERADVNRATFYAHYSDQYGLLEAIENELLGDIRRYLDGVVYTGAGGTTERMLTRILEYVKSNAELCRVLLGDNGEFNFRIQVMQLVREQFVTEWTASGIVSMADAEYIYTFVLNGCMGLIRRWLDSGTDMPPASLSAMILKLSGSGFAGYGVKR